MINHELTNLSNSGPVLPPHTPIVILFVTAKSKHFAEPAQPSQTLTALFHCDGLLEKNVRSLPRHGALSNHSGLESLIINLLNYKQHTCNILPATRQGDKPKTTP